MISGLSVDFSSRFGKHLYVVYLVHCVTKIHIIVKKVALPEGYANAHLKRLRLSMFTMMGRLISHTRQVLRVAEHVLEALNDLAIYSRSCTFISFG